MENIHYHRRTPSASPAEHRLIFETKNPEKTQTGPNKNEMANVNPADVNDIPDFRQQLDQSTDARRKQSDGQIKNFQFIRERWQQSTLQQLPDQEAARDFMQATGGEWKEGSNTWRTIGPDGNWLLWKDKFIEAKDPSVANMSNEQKEAAMQALHNAHFKYNNDLQIAYAHGLVPGTPQFQQWKTETIYYINQELAPFNVHVIDAKNTAHLDWAPGSSKEGQLGGFGTLTDALNKLMNGSEKEKLAALLLILIALIEAMLTMEQEKKRGTSPADGKEKEKGKEEKKDPIDAKIDEALKEKGMTLEKLRAQTEDRVKESEKKFAKNGDELGKARKERDDLVKSGDKTRDKIAELKKNPKENEKEIEALTKDLEVITKKLEAVEKKLKELEAAKAALAQDVSDAKRTLMKIDVRIGNAYLESIGKNANFGTFRMTDEGTVRIVGDKGTLTAYLQKKHPGQQEFALQEFKEEAAAWAIDENIGPAIDTLPLPPFLKSAIREMIGAKAAEAKTSKEVDPDAKKADGKT